MKQPQWKWGPFPGFSWNGRRSHPIFLLNWKRFQDNFKRAKKKVKKLQMCKYFMKKLVFIFSKVMHHDGQQFYGFNFWVNMRNSEVCGVFLFLKVAFLNFKWMHFVVGKIQFLSSLLASTTEMMLAKVAKGRKNIIS